MPTDTPMSEDAIDTARAIVAWFRGQRTHDEQTIWPLYCHLQAKIQGALQEREDARQEALQAIKDAAGMIWDLMDEEDLPEVRETEITAWLQHWAPETFRVPPFEG